MSNALLISSLYFLVHLRSHTARCPSFNIVFNHSFKNKFELNPYKLHNLVDFYQIEVLDKLRKAMINETAYGSLLSHFGRNVIDKNKFSFKYFNSDKSSC